MSVYRNFEQDTLIFTHLVMFKVIIHCWLLLVEWECLQPVHLLNGAVCRSSGGGKR